MANDGRGPQRRPRRGGRRTQEAGLSPADAPGWALVTGASSGIGAALARQLAAAGWSVVLTARSADRLEALATEVSALGRACRVFVADLSATSGVEALLAFVAAEGLALELLVNNAGVGAGGDFATLAGPRQCAMLGLNVDALTRLTHACLGPMRARGHGAIINVASVAAFQPVPFMAAYAASKAYVLSLSLALWEENRGHGVHVMAVCPGSTDTGFFAAAEMSGGGPYQQTPEQVAAETMAALARRRPLVVTGGGNRAMVAAGRFLPRRWMLAAAARFARPRMRAAAGG